MPEFGTKEPTWPGAAPIMLCDGFAVTVGFFEFGGPAVPDGELWVCTGFSIAASFNSLGYFVGSGFSPGGANVGNGMVSQDLPIVWWGSINWSGAMPFGPTQAFKGVCSASITAVGMSITAWGYSLPYVG